MRVRSNARLMFVHHLVVVLLSYLSISPPFFQYYCVFFFGVIEVSSAPMSLMDMCHPRNVGWSQLAQTNAVLKMFNSVSRAVFALTYMITRALYFPYVIVAWVVPDLLELIRAADPPVPKWVSAVVLAAAERVCARPSGDRHDGVAHDRQRRCPEGMAVDVPQLRGHAWWLAQHHDVLPIAERDAGSGQQRLGHWQDGVKLAPGAPGDARNQDTTMAVLVSEPRPLLPDVVGVVNRRPAFAAVAAPGGVHQR